MKKAKKAKTGKRRLNLGRLFDNSQFTLIISILIAVFGWLVVSLVIEPNTQDKVTGIPVDLDYNAQTLQSMGLDVVTEGEVPRVTVRVEGERAVVDLLDYDVRFGQGFLFAPPRPLRPDGASATGGAAPNQAQDTQGSNGSAPPSPGATSAAPPAQRITTGSAALARRL